MAVSTSTVTVGDLEFRYRSAGPPDGEAIIALHGFPETSISFTTLLEAGGVAGYRVIAPDQRGYSPGARPDPADTSSYYYDKIVDDVIAIASALGIERFHLVAHDHGCLVGWCVAARYPQHVATYVPMSVPHPDAFSEAMVSDPEQQVASQYFHLFASVQGAALEKFAKRVPGFWGGPANSDNFSPEMISEYTALFSDPKTLRAALNWYNGVMEAGIVACPPVLPGSPFEGNADFAAMIEPWTGSRPLGKVPAAVPVLHLWGEQDNALKRGAVEASGEHCEGEYNLVVMQCGHWMMQAAGAACVKEILDHAAAHPIGAPAAKL